MDILYNLDSKINGRWTKSEHQKFIAGLDMYGRNWKKIQQFIGTRNGSQIRSHAQKFFLKVKKTLKNIESPELALDSISEAETPKQCCRKQTGIQYENSDNSFFLDHIIRQTNDQTTFNFWEMFVDMAEPRQIGSESRTGRRKDSFVLLDISQNRQQFTIDYMGIIGSEYN